MKLFSQFYDKLEQKPILFSFLIFLLALLIYYLSNLSPLVAIFGTHLSQVWVSMVVGAVNTVLVWLILKRFALKFAARLLLTIGFAFGTVHFYAAITGTTWF